MILTCPSCATGYFVPDDTIGPEGRKVRCKSCSHVWRAEPAEDPLILTTPPEEAPQIEASPPAEVPESLAETPAPELPKAFRARAEQTRRLRRAATHGAIWAGLASVFAAILAASWLFRIEVVELWPRAAAAYAAIGSPVNAVGLEFEAIRARPLRNDPGQVVVAGALRNIRDREVVAPAVRVALLDAEGVEVEHRILAIRAAPVLPGKVQGFAVLIPDPGARGVGIGVRFVEQSARTKAPAQRADDSAVRPATPAPEQAAALAAPTTPQQTPAAASGTPDGSPPPASGPPGPTEGGLRPAISDLGISGGAVDARPASPPGTAASQAPVRNTRSATP
jgi:predicted Zn finger-like uncharacterized protein